MYFFSCQHIIVFSWQPFHRPLQGEGVLARVTIGIEVLLLCAFTAKQGTSLMKMYFDVAGTGTEMSITSKQLLIWELVVMERAGVVQRWVESGAKARGKGMGSQSQWFQVRNKWNLLTSNPVSHPAWHTECWHVSLAYIVRHRFPDSETE